ncbi:MAG: hypothetical protein LJE89_11135 [Deltaproteobacteria bacterium]|nr:hypothetical protein [Deltaproteobacteria bacterium]
MAERHGTTPAERQLFRLRRIRCPLQEVNREGARLAGRLERRIYSTAFQSI